MLSWQLIFLATLCFLLMQKRIRSEVGRKIVVILFHPPLIFILIHILIFILILILDLNLILRIALRICQATDESHWLIFFLSNYPNNIFDTEWQNKKKLLYLLKETFLFTYWFQHNFHKVKTTYMWEIQLPFKFKSS